MPIGKLIDRYTLGARVAPVLVIALCLFLAISAWIPFSNWPVKLLGGGAVLALAAFVLAQVARDAGKAIEGPLWKAAGGLPSIRLLRHRDPALDPGIKHRIHRRLVDLKVVDRMPTADEEATDPDAADRIYATCSAWLRNKAMELRAKSPFDVVHAENIAYGFRRNMLGIRRYGLAVFGFSVSVAGPAVAFDRLPVLEVAALLLIGTYIAFGVNEAGVRRAGEEYAIRLFNAVETIPLSPGPAGAATTGKARKPRTSAKA